MGEYADLEVERQQRAAGERMRRELATQTAAQRHAAGQADLPPVREDR